MKKIFSIKLNRLNRFSFDEFKNNSDARILRADTLRLRPRAPNWAVVYWWLGKSRIPSWWLRGRHSLCQMQINPFLLCVFKKVRHINADDRSQAHHPRKQYRRVAARGNTPVCRRRGVFRWRARDVYVGNGDNIRRHSGSVQHLEEKKNNHGKIVE